MIFDWTSDAMAQEMSSIASDILGVRAYQLIDVKSGEELRRGQEARAHFIRCTFCRKDVGRASKRAHRRTMWSDELNKAISGHIFACGARKARELFCLFSTGCLPSEYADRIGKIVADATSDNDDLYGRVRRRVVSAALRILPAPPGSLKARCIETGLALMARGADDIDWSTVEPLL